MDYDNWKLSNKEPSQFYCERCDQTYDIDLYCELNDCCESCDEKIQLQEY